MHPELLGIDDRIWLIVSLAFTLLFHLLNRKPRADVDAAVIPLKVPERRYRYTEAALAKRCLIAIDQLRDEHGIAEDDTRHPDVMSGRPWPLEAETK
jgi:hypothetical protein